jgi:hypothetical protein
MNTKEILIVGNGTLGKAIYFSLYKKNIMSTTIDKEDINTTNFNNYDVIFICVPSFALKELTNKLPKNKIIISCTKGILENRLPSEWLPINISIGGFYKAEKIYYKKIGVYLGYDSELNKDAEEIIKKIFKIKGKINNTKEIEFVNVLKNIYLLYSTQEKNISKIIFDLKSYNITSKVAINAFLDDYKCGIKYKTRNRLFSELFFLKNKTIKQIKQEVGLVEGLESLKNLNKKTKLILTIDKAIKNK